MQPVETFLEIGLDAAGALIPFLRGLPQQLHHNPRDDFGNAGIDLIGRQRFPRDMAVYHLHGVIGGEGKDACQQLVERGAEGVKVGSVVQGTIESARLLRRYVGQRAFKNMGAVDGGILDGKQCRNAEVDQLELPAGRIQDDIGRVDIFMDDAFGVNLTQTVGYPYGYTQSFFQRELLAGTEYLKGLAAEILHDQDGRLPAHFEIKRVYDPVLAKRLGDIEFLGVAGNLLGAGTILLHRFENDRVLFLFPQSSINK